MKPCQVLEALNDDTDGFDKKVKLAMQSSGGTSSLTDIQVNLIDQLGVWIFHPLNLKKIMFTQEESHYNATMNKIMLLPLRPVIYYPLRQLFHFED